MVKRNLILVLIAIGIVMGVSCKTNNSSTDFTTPNGFTDGIEGPATDEHGNIFAVNFKRQGTIGKVSPNGAASLFLELPKGSIGNGIRFGKNQQMYIADYVNHNVLEIDLATKSISIFAHDSTLNQPNDLAIAPNQTLYASDPNWADNTGKLWKVTETNGFELLEEGMGTTNGIEVSLDGKKLYVNESVQRNIWVYDILPNGNVENKQKFYQFKDFGLDGMRFSNDGFLYVTRYDKGSVVKFSTEGEIVKEYNLKGKKPSNLTFSKDYKYAYVTMADRGCLEAIEL